MYICRQKADKCLAKKHGKEITKNEEKADYYSGYQYYYDSSYRGFFMENERYVQ